MNVGGRALRVAPSLLEARFAAGCDTGRCVGRCCRSGVWLDPAERDRVLAHADLVRRAMDPDQSPDTRRWFSKRVVADPDFPSGQAVHTRVRDGRCVFLNRGGRCVLQKASSPGLQLKPFFCIAFPVTVDGGVLTLDDKDFRAGQPCCESTEGGPLTVFDTCGMELRHVLGAAGVARLRRIALGRPARPRS
ncbi:MAG TPA: DUF3109 family protein [Vicinamibacteria bacterium]